MTALRAVLQRYATTLGVVLWLSVYAFFAGPRSWDDILGSTVIWVLITWAAEAVYRRRQRKRACLCVHASGDNAACPRHGKGTGR